MQVLSVNDEIFFTDTASGYFDRASFLSVEFTVPDKVPSL